MPESEDFERVGDLLGDACDAAAPDSKCASTSAPSTLPASREPATDVARTVAAAWPEIAGAEVAANASPVQLKNGRLTVSTSSSAWADTLRYMSADMATRLNERLGSEVIDEIVFRHAGWEERSPQGGTQDIHGADTRSASDVSPSGRLTAEQQQALADVEGLDLPLEIREKVTRAMHASFVRNQGGFVR